MSEPYMPPEARIEAVGDSLMFEGVTYKDTDGLGKICRLIQTRFPSPAVATVYRGEQLCLTVDIHERAKRSLVEPSGGGLHYQKFRPFKGIIKK